MQFGEPSGPSVKAASVPVLSSITGRIFWKRTWHYNNPKIKGFMHKEYLPQARVTLMVISGALQVPLYTVYLTPNGAFRFENVPFGFRLALKITLIDAKHHVSVYGLSDVKNLQNFCIRKNRLVWWLMPIGSVLPARRVDFGDLEVTEPLFAELCDMYKSVRVGQIWMPIHTGRKFPTCRINYPQTGKVSFHRNGQLYVLPGDTKDRDVLLHEYAHFVGYTVHGTLNHPGYTYNDDYSNRGQGGHSWTSKEWYQTAWNEGYADFIGAMIMDDATYHDDYDTILTETLGKTVSIGSHCEGSIATALWRLCKHHKVPFDRGFWRAFAEHKHVRVDTALNFYENWLRIGVPGLDKLREVYSTCGMKYGYRYVLSGKYAPKTSAGIVISSVQQLYNIHGVIGGGTLAEYSEEFYNHNKRLRPGCFAAGATPSAYKLVANSTYWIPERYLVAV